MANTLYNIVFQGKIQAGFELPQVKEQLGRLFGVSEDKLSMMFSGKAIVIKKSADRATAEKYLNAMNKAGAIVQVVSLEGEVVDFTEPEQPTETVENTVQVKHLDSSTSLTLGAVGEQLIPSQEFVEGQFNTEGMTMAPVGSDVTDQEPPPAPYQADLSNLSMAEAGERILDQNAPPAETRGTKIRLEEK